MKFIKYYRMGDKILQKRFCPAKLFVCMHHLHGCLVPSSALRIRQRVGELLRSIPL